jgi:hypothetical protein
MMMHIDGYSFGKITIDGDEYSNDVIVSHERILHPWWREDGHKLHIRDLYDLLQELPDTLVIGTGYDGVMKVPKRLVRELEAKGLTVHVKKSREAVELFNQLSGRKALAIHLTC